VVDRECARGKRCFLLALPLLLLPLPLTITMSPQECDSAEEFFFDEKTEKLYYFFNTTGILHKDPCSCKHSFP